jgi:CBS-domain-containing membrane protein
MEEDWEKAHDLFAAHGFGLLPVVDQEMHLQSVVTMLECLRRAS